MEVGARVRVNPAGRWGHQARYGVGVISRIYDEDSDTYRGGYHCEVRFDDRSAYYAFDDLIRVWEVGVRVRVVDNPSLQRPGAVGVIDGYRRDIQSDQVVFSVAFDDGMRMTYLDYQLEPASTEACEPTPEVVTKPPELKKGKKRMKKALREATEAIAAAGFPYMKIELEGTTRRGYQRQCTDCQGQQYHQCQACNGDGAVQNGTVGVARIAQFVECTGCNGEGRGNCNACNGRGRVGGEYSDTGPCNRFIFNYLAEKWYGQTLEERMRDSGASDYYRAFPEQLSYGRFYHDGSVDSEFTFTFPVSDPTVALDVIEAFKAFAKAANGTGKIDVRGAGMHIAVLPTSTYPGGPTLNRVKYENFKTEVQKLLPALYFLGSASHQSRGMSYRRPQISANDKYSAIHAAGNRTCLEYRVFETCYDRPEALYEFIQVIANTLRYYADPTLKVKQLGKKFGFPAAESRSKQPVSRFFKTVESVRILNAQVSYLKPKDVSFKKLKSDRGVLVTVTRLKEVERRQESTLKSQFKQYIEQQKTIRSRPLNGEEKRQVDWYIIEGGYTHEKAVEMVRGLRKLPTWSEFKKQNLPAQRSSSTVVTV